MREWHQVKTKGILLNQKQSKRHEKSIKMKVKTITASNDE